MNLKKSHRLGLIFAGIVAFFLLNSMILARNFLQVRNHQANVRQTYRLINELNRVLLYVHKSEAHSRGDRLFPFEGYQTDYAESSANLWKTLEAVEDAALGDPHILEEVRKLREPIVVHMAELDSIMKMAPKDRPPLTEKSVKSTRDYSIFLRTVAQSLIAEQTNILHQRASETEKKARIVLLNVALALISNLILVAIAFGLVRRQMRAQDEELARNARENWIQTALGSFGGQIVGQHTIKGVAEGALRFLSEVLEVPTSNFFFSKNSVLKRMATHGGVSESAAEFKIGESLVGAAARQTAIQQLAEIPENYFAIGSSLGRARPTHLTFMPVLFEGHLLAVIELATFEKMDATKLELLRLIQERLGTIVNMAISRERQQELLEETQMQAEELQAQQEELRSSNEELEQQTESLSRSQESLQSQQEELRQINEELEAQSRALERQQILTTERNADLEAARRDLESRAADLERANSYKSEFLAKMSHELRTPLNSMLILSSLLSENKEKNLSEQQTEFASTIHDAGSDLLNLINDILDLSKLEARKLSLRIEPLNVRGLCDQMAAQFRPLVERKNLKFLVEVDADVPELIRTDRQRLEQVLRNFVSNAAKFTDEGSVTLRLGLLDSETLRFAVVDTGVGIPDEKKQKIFEAFEQADSSISRKYGGTGLGLTISRELANLLQGKIHVESQLDKGSTFALDIPINAKVEARAETPRHSGEPIARTKTEGSSPTVRVSESAVTNALKGIESGKSGRTVLIVEDDDTFRKATANAARAHGFAPIEAEDGETALEILRRHRPSAIMLDIKLPGISGMGLLERIKQEPNLRHIPIHMISGMEYQLNAMRMGAVGYLGKPASLADVKSAFQKIEQVLDKRERKVLVVEDDQRQQLAMKELLAAPGIEIVSAHFGKEALALIEKIEFDCIIVDLTLPDIAGLELMNSIHERLGEKVPPIIVYTGRELNRDEEEKLREFSESIILKGAKSPERLLDEVNLFLHRVESDLPEKQRQVLNELRMREGTFENRHVLLVDDDIRNIFALTSALESKGLKVTPARNGFEAIEALEKDEGSIDVVLMDIMMPKMDGYEAIRRIRKMDKFKRLPIIALTAKAMRGDHEKCIEAGANDYFPKPVNLMNLISVLKVWLSGKRVLP